MIEISKAELEVMNIIWEQHSARSHEIVEALQGKSDWHEKTVKSLLNRLVKKGAVGFNKAGRVYDYFPLINKSDYQQTETKSLIDRLFGGRVSPMVANFVRKEGLSKEDINELKSLISQWENKHD